MKSVFTIALCLSLTACGAGSLLGTPYSRMTCSQFACIYTGHAPSTAKLLFEEGHPGTPKVGDIVAFGGRHVAVMTRKGLVDSVPERGVGLVSASEMKNAWYAGPIHIVETKMSEGAR